MKSSDIEDYNERYSRRLKEFGYSPETLGWGKNGRQEVRFAVLADMAIKNPSSSVLDVGCGFGDLYAFMKKKGWNAQYTGIDIVPGLLEVGRSVHDNIDLRNADISLVNDLQVYDYVIASGIFNAKLKGSDNKIHMSNTIKAMFDHARVAVCIDFMSTYVDFEKEGSWHTDPIWAFELARSLSRRIILRYDYMPFEFALFIFKDDSISEANTFKQL